MTYPQPGHAPTPAPPRPVDVDTGFWLWVTALPLLLIGQFADAMTVPTPVDRSMVVIVATFLTLTIGGVLLGLMFLVRAGYRWARTMLTVGGVTTIVYTAMSLLGVPRQPVAAVIYAATGIIGCVLIGGGIYLLHRPDSQRFFVR